MQSISINVVKLVTKLTAYLLVKVLEIQFNSNQSDANSLQTPDTRYKLNEQCNIQLNNSLFSSAIPKQMSARLSLCVPHISLIYLSFQCQNNHFQLFYYSIY